MDGLDEGLALGELVGLEDGEIMGESVGEAVGIQSASQISGQFSIAAEVEQRSGFSSTRLQSTRGLFWQYRQSMSQNSEQATTAAEVQLVPSYITVISSLHISRFNATVQHSNSNL